MALLKYIGPTALPHNIPTSVTDSTNWGINEALIKMIKVVTLSNDWGLLIACDSDFASGMFGITFIGLHLAGDQKLYLDLPYIDNDSNNSVHLYFYDYNTTDGATAEVFGEEARIT